MMTGKDREILSKIKKVPRNNDEIPHECDNRPNPFENLTLDEMEYLQEHVELLKYVQSE